jgi:hypothetical protein
LAVHIAIFIGETPMRHVRLDAESASCYASRQMKPLAVVGALVGGLIGAIAWGGITAVTNVEIGYMATGVGFLVGFGSTLLGGKGTVNGVLCGIIALLSIFGGKMATIRFIAPGEMRKMIQADPKAATLTPAQIDHAVDLAVGQLDFATTLDWAKQSLDPIDILFAVFGVAAAFQIGSGNRRTSATAYTQTSAPPGGPVAPPAPGTPVETLPVPAAPVAPPPAPEGEAPPNSTPSAPE